MIPYRSSPLRFLTIKQNNMKHFLSLALLLAGTALEAQTWSELPLVTSDYSTYTNARVKVDPVTLTPYVAFKARKELTTGNDYTHALVYRYLDNQWQQVAASTDQVYSSYLDFGFSKTGRSYIAYADADFTNKGTTLEQIIPAAHASKLLASNMENAQATYLGLGVVSDNQLITACTGNTSATYKNVPVISIYDAETKSWTASKGPTGNTEIYKTALCSSPSGEVYLAAMERSAPYAIHVFQYGAEGWTELGTYPTEGTNAIYVGTYKLSTDQAGHLYTLTCDNATGSDCIRIRQFDAETQSWTTLGDAPTPISTTDRHQLAAHAVRPDGVHVITYQDINDGSLPKVITYDANTLSWSEPVTLSSVPVNNSGSISIDFAGNGIGYVCYVDDNNAIRVCRYLPETLSHDAFDGLLCDTLSHITFDVPSNLGSGKLYDYTSALSGQSYTFGGYAYNNILRDSIGEVCYRDTTEIGLNIRKRVSNGVQPGFITTASAHNLKASRIRVSFIYYNSASMKDRMLSVFGSSTPYTSTTELVEPATQGEFIAELLYGPNAIYDIDLSEKNYHYIGFYTESTGFGIRDIVIGWSEDEAIEQVADDHRHGELHIYNLNGQEMGRPTDLPAGAYIQRQGTHTEKVIIR